MKMDPDRHASTEEVALAFAALGAADFVRLGRVAQLRARGLPEVDWRDLLHEAVQRSLDGARRWPLDVPFLVFLAQTIRSVASEAWRRRAIVRLVHSDGAAPDAADVLATLPDETADPERQLVARDLVARLEQLFAEDEAALAVLAGLAEGLTPFEIQTRAHLGAIAYDSTRRRMRRLIARALPETL
jgi:DNA-directed RNA polymerase specialized sigma24 family protein